MIVTRGLGLDSVDRENGVIAIYGMGLWCYIPPITPDCRIFLIDQDNRSLLIDQDSRVQYINDLDNRTIVIDFESRIVQVSCT